MERFQDLTAEQKQDSGLLLILLIFLGITPLFDAGLDHDVMYWLILLAAPILLILTFRSKPTWTLRWQDPGLYLVLLTIWAGVSFFWSIHQLRTMIELIQLFSFVMTFFIMRKIGSEFQAKALRIGALTAVALALFGILQFIFVKSGRVEATFPHPNPFGTYLAMFSLYLLGLQLREKSKIQFASLVILLTAIVLSGSKGTYLAILAAAPLAYLGLPRQNRKNSLLQTLALAIATGLAVGFIFILTPFVQEKVSFGTNLFETVARVGALEGSATDRIEFWRVSLDLLKNRPLTGYGYGTFFAAHYIEYHVNETYTRFAHNHYLQLAAELGLPGIALFLGFMAMSLRVALRNLKNRSQTLMFSGAFAACVMFLLHVLIEFSWSFPAVPIVFFAMAGVVIGKGEEGAAQSESSEPNEPIKQSEPEEQLEMPELVAPFEQTESTELVGQKDKHHLRIPSSILACALIITFLLTAWQVTSNKLNEKGLNASNAGQLEQGIEHYELAHKIYPFSANNRRLMSNNYLQIYQTSKNQNDLAMAIQRAEEAVRLTPYSGTEHHNLAGLYVATNDLPKAKIHYQAAIQYNAYNLLSFIDFAAYYLRQSEREKAVVVLLDGSNRVNLAIGSNTDPVEKLSTYQQGIIINDILAKIYTKNGDIDKAEEFQSLVSDLKTRFEQAQLEYAKTTAES